MATWTESLRRAEVVAVGAALARKGLIRGREGNVSCRLDGNLVLMTPRGADKGRLHAHRLVVCAIGEPPPAAASSEALMHLETYRACPELRAVVHAHPISILGLDARGGLPEPHGLEEGGVLLGKVARVAGLRPGSLELAQAAARALRRAPVAVMTRHGVVAGGGDLWEALERVEVAELLAHVALARRSSAVFP